MSGISDKATVTLHVNGAQAKQMLAEIEKKVKDTEKAIVDLKNKNADPRDIERHRKLLRTYQKQLDEMRSATEGVSRALRTLDTATPRQLEKTLRTLNRQLKDMTPGTKAWDEHTRKIQQVTAQLKELKQQLQVQESLWQRFSNWWFKCGQAVAAIVVGVQTAVGTLRKYVNDYAGMEEEMANTRKFTGLAEDAVRELNSEFKRMDTRTPREQLNALAQEAGRVGKNTKEAVKSYVEAADVINVSLDELGDGATQQIAKLSDLFGIEKLYGTRDAMLKTSSVVNDLSQSCTASAPYIVEFTKRLAGVGQQADQTIPEIMAFGAVLDASGQNVEMAATAISQTIMKLFQKPKEFARKVGMDVAAFTKTLGENTTKGLMMFLEHLNSIGGEKAIATLSPLFKELGLDGARMSSVLAVCAGRIDMLREKMAEANAAFAKGTSTLNEYNIFNNTVQASIDKARKRLHDLTVELGERLYPLMKHIYSSGSALTRVLLTTIRFLSDNKTAIAGAAVSLAAFTIVAKGAALAMAAYNGCIKLVNAGYKALLATQASLQAGMLLMKAAVYAVTGHLNRARVAMRQFNAAASASVWGAVAVALGLVVGKLVDMYQSSKRAKEEALRLRQEHEEYRKSLVDINKAAANYAQSESARIKKLYETATNETASRKERLAAVNEMKKAYPGYFDAVSTEAILAGQAASQYAELAKSIRDAAKARAALDKMTENEGKILELEMERDGKQGRIDAAQAAYDVEVGNLSKLNSLRASKSGNKPANLDALIKLQKKNTSKAKKNLDEVAGEILDINAKIKEIEDAQDALAEKAGAINNRLGSVEVSAGKSGKTPSPYISQMAEAKERLKAELEAKRKLAKANAEYKREMEKAKGDWEAASADNVMLYASGNRQYSDYLAEKERLDLKYVQDRIDIYESLYDGETKEQQKLLLKYDEDYQELLLKRAEAERSADEAASKRKVSDLKQEYAARKAMMETEFGDVSSALYQNLEAQEESLFRLKIDYLVKYRDSYKANSKEWAEYEQQIQEAESNRMLEKQRRFNALREKWSESKDSAILEATHKTELALLEELYKRKKISESEFLEWKHKMEEAYRLKQKKAEDDRRNYVKIDGAGGDGKVVDTRTSSEQKNAKLERIRTERDQTLAALRELYDRGVISEEDYAKRCAEFRSKAGKDMVSILTEGLDSQTAMLFKLGGAWLSLFETIQKDGAIAFDNIKDIAQTTVETLCAGLEVYSQFAQAEAQIEIASTEKKYDAMIKAAEGNSYKVNKLEKEKDAEVAKLKAESSRKQFQIKIIEAIAQTAANAIMAYGSLAGIPVVGPTLGALAAAAATALGMAQVALMKKQQQAAEAQGYAEGGFTKPGDKYEPAGIVHAGEWVASQKLVGNPHIRPMLEALDYVQRTNSFGYISPTAVSRSITAPMVLASQPSPQVIVRQTQTANAGDSNLDNIASAHADTMKRLAERLDEPFVTVNTVTGDYGINQAQARYRRLLSNKSPKTIR